MKILLAEDEPFNLIVLEEMIKIFYPQAEVSIAENGAIAFDMLKVNSYDLLLSDVNMPVMDGYGLIKKIKEELNLEMPSVVVTAFAIQGDKEKLLLSGFDDYISKPIDMSELQTVLRKYFGD
jgi:two-component system, cell cycle response regulator DivK